LPLYLNSRICPIKIQHESYCKRKDTSALHEDALSYPQLALGMIAIFYMWVVEVSTAVQFTGIHETTFSKTPINCALMFHCSGPVLMIGRWTGAVKPFTQVQVSKRSCAF